MANIELRCLVEHCKQLPTYKDALPIIVFIQSWGAENGALNESALAIKDIREHFRLLAPQPENSDTKRVVIPPTIGTPEVPELKFFVGVKSDLSAAFKEVLRKCIAKINTKGKKEWFCLYAAWRYYKKQHDTDGGYVDFYTDIDNLFPGLLEDVRNDLPGNRRLKPYCDMLRYEYNNWAVNNGKLPPMQIWAHEAWIKQYKNSRKNIMHMQSLVREFYTTFATFFSNN